MTGHLPLVLLAVSLLCTVVPAAVLSDECQTEVKKVADYENGYLCPAKSNACHHTCTRLAPIFVNSDATSTKIASFDLLYRDICGADSDHKTNTECSPQANTVYQVTHDDKGAGHSLFLACLKTVTAGEEEALTPKPVPVAGGCAVLQGVAGSFTLGEWTTGLSPGVQTRTGDVVKGNKLKGSPETYGMYQMLDKAVLHEFLVLLNGFVTANEEGEATGTMRSYMTIWDCAGGRTGSVCKDLLAAGDGSALKPFDDAAWKILLKNPTAGSKIIANKFADWDGKCRDFAAARLFGDTFPSPYCTDVNPEKRKVCTMGLGLPAWWVVKRGETATKPGIPGTFPLTEVIRGEVNEKYECCPRATATASCTGL